MPRKRIEQRALAEQVRGLDVPRGHLAIWALGQQGYLLKGGRDVVIIDPYLSNYVQESTPGKPEALARQVPVVVNPQELGMVTAALSTHHHADHCDPDTLLPLLKAAPGARLLTSHTGRDVLLEHGADPARVEVPRVETKVELGHDLSITAIPSAHYEFEPDAQGNPAYLGFIVEINGVTLYHSGDSIIYEGLVERLKAQPIDIMCLPINGRDWFREQQELLGNMDYREAAELASAVGTDVLLPGHNDMFSGNRINPAYLLDYLSAHHPEQRAHFLQAGELYYYVS
ncbi:MAG TPA: MBL fold metallo-hydrolase [Chloroflexia bacterium]|nr:MBL fold metallo-hydrolase [Chloroflexia bacterium]